MFKLLSSLKENKITYSENTPLSQYTTFKTGGKCKLMVLPSTPSEAVTAIGLIRSHNVPFYVIGNGSNIIAPDEPGDEIYLCTSGLSSIEVRKDRAENIVCAGSGAILAKVAYEAYKSGLSGMEFAHGIPGSLGGACVMNAGAYGGQMSDIVLSTTYVNRENQVVTISTKEHLYGYRKSVFTADDLILSSSLKLNPGDPIEIKRIMDELAVKRRTSQPLEYPSAGSTFKRPEGYFAGKLIEDAGLKGYTIGGAQVSIKHAGFIINVGNATSSDILALISHVQETVYKNSGVILETEVKVLKGSK